MTTIEQAMEQKKCVDSQNSATSIVDLESIASSLLTNEYAGQSLEASVMRKSLHQPFEMFGTQIQISRPVVLPKTNARLLNKNTVSPGMSGKSL